MLLAPLLDFADLFFSFHSTQNCELNKFNQVCANVQSICTIGLVAGSMVEPEVQQTGRARASVLSCYKRHLLAIISLSMHGGLSPSAHTSSTIAVLTRDLEPIQTIEYRLKPRGLDHVGKGKHCHKLGKKHPPSIRDPFDQQELT